ncbi:hypothetical protein V2J09_024177 [Rumex salicifolius]
MAQKRAFEVFYRGSWQAVERIRISLGTLVLHIVEFGYIFEEKSFLSTLRLRTRRASLSDCTCFLRPGVDICVLSPSRDTENSWEAPQPIWVEARIVSVERKPHDTQCACKFFVKLNDIQDHRAGLKGKLSKEVTEVTIEQISIFQRFDLKPADHNKHYRWAASEDCSSVLKTRVFLGKFQADVAWMVVTSVHKQFVFDIRSIQNRLVYQVLDASLDSFASDVHLSGINFKLDGELVVPVVIPFVPFSLLEPVPRVEEHEEEEEEMAFSSYEFHEVRRSKRRHVKPDRYLGEIGLEEQDITALRIGWKSLKPDIEEEEMPPLLLSNETTSDESSEEEEDEQSLRYEILTRSSGTKDRKKKSLQDEELSKTDEKTTTKKKTKTISLSKLVSKDRENAPSEDVSAQKRKHQAGKQKIQDEQHLAIVPVQHYKNQVAAGEQKHLQAEINLNNDSLEDDIPLKFYKRRGKKGRGVGRSKKLSEMNSREEDDDDDDDGVLETKASRENYKYWDDDKAQASTSTKQTRGRKHRPLFSSSYKDSYTDHGSSSAASGKKKTLDAGAYKALISAYMKNIQLTIENKLPEITDPLKQLFGDKDLNEDIEDSDEEETEEEEEDSELVMLWKEVDLTLAALYLEREAKNEAADEQGKSSEAGVTPCQHTFEVDDEIGLLCSICGHVVTEIKDISPDFLHSTGWAPKHNRPARQGQVQGKDDIEHKLIDEVGVEFICKPSSSDNPATEDDENVWSLIPNMSHKLHPHQRKAFEFLWRNIAGALVPSEMESKKDKIGGCVISHTPGAGKTFLIIAFLVSYLKLFPGKRPLVLAPKTTLYTWYKEIIKWQFPVPVYQIHGRRTYRDRIYMRKVERNNSSANIVPSGDVMHVLDCLEKLQKWHAHPSVLLMGYTSFMTMMRDDSKYEYRKYMGQLLRDSPGILILDEGHNPRSTKSRLRKALMKIDTPMRILLSGTLFQNNFGEYFNTLSLARPVFVDEVLKILDPKYKRKVNNLNKNRITIENRARKVFMDIIARKINSGDPEERAEGLNELKNMTNGFIDVYEGGASENLPGLQAYTLMMKPTPMQHDILVRLHGRMSESKGFPLELELMITLGSIHPWLIKTAVCANKFLSEKELASLDEHRLDPTKGSKVKFVLGLVHRSMMRKEKVLIFCHNIAPITLFLELFRRLYGWTKGEEMLVLSGELELFERGRVMDKFEERGSPSKVMLASINACAEGISLTAASRVILLDSEWNPSKQKQAIARAFRPGQERMVYVYQLLVKGTLEEDKYGRTTWKEWVSCMIFSEELVEEPSRWQAEKIEDELLREIVEEDHANLFHSIMKNEKASYENPLRVND